MQAVFSSFFSRPHRVGLRAVALCAALMAAGVHAQTVDLDHITQLAKQRATQPYSAANGRLPPALAALNYDQVRDIRWRPERALWRAEQLPFEAMFFHLGLYQREPVLINEVSPQGARHIPYRTADFD